MSTSSASGDPVILATAGYDHTIRFWQARSGICHRTVQHPDSVSLSCVALINQQSDLVKQLLININIQYHPQQIYHNIQTGIWLTEKIRQPSIKKKTLNYLPGARLTDQI